MAHPVYLLFTQVLLPNLASLDLIECPIAEGDKYREDVFAAVPHLTFLDGIDRLFHWFADAVVLIGA